MHRCTNRARGAAFTLLETLAALGLAATLLGGIYAIASGTTQLSSEISREQHRHLTEQAFVSLCRNTLGGLSPTANVALRIPTDAGVPLSEIVISGDPTAFSFGGVPAGSTAVVLSSLPGADGFLSVNLRYLAEPDIDAFDRGNRKVGRELPLLEGVQRFEWRFFDRRGNRWKSKWDFRSGRPALAELILKFDGRPPARHVIFIPDLQPSPVPVPRPIQEKPEDDDN